MRGRITKTLSIPVCREQLNKGYCIEEARRIIREGLIDGMTENQIAREIYFHAAVFYFCEKTGRFHKYRQLADPIDLADGGDTGLRRMAFAAGWLLGRKGKNH